MAIITTRSFKLALAATFIAVALVPHSASAHDPVAGESKAQICLTCHGKGDTVQGIGTPIISGQYLDYLVEAMKSYRSGVRSNPIMAGFMANLTDRDIEDIAAFYAREESKLFTPTE